MSIKHKVLATTASIFKSFGLLNPAVIAYKIFLQKLWQDITMGRTTSYHLQQEWNQLLQTIPKLITTQDQQEGYLLQCNQHPNLWILRQQ